jgi:parallel beta-helix repeat protein
MKAFNLFICLLGFILLTVTKAVYAETIVIYPNTIISFPKTYTNVTLDLSHGSFIIKNNAQLTIKNCNIIGTISPDNPILINIDSGKLDISNTQAKISTINISPHPTTQSLHYFITMNQGQLSLNGNSFKIDNAYTAGFLITNANIATTGIQITHNQFEKFHGVIYLLASDNAVVSDNNFSNNSYGHIVLISNNSSIVHNTIAFSGNDQLGNAMDIIDSSNVNIINNSLLTPTCHGIYVLNSRNMLIKYNRIFGGITYAMNIYTYAETQANDHIKSDTIKNDTDYIKTILSSHKMKNNISDNITITNNFMSQNRYGIAASDVDGLVVSNNYFIQRFSDANSRKFWTDNNNLFKNVTHLTWSNNFYKEAYTQAINGDNSKSNKFVIFPQTGGIIL